MGRVSGRVEFFAGGPLAGWDRVPDYGWVEYSLGPAAHRALDLAGAS